MLSSNTTRNLHKRIKINTLLVRTATPVFLTVMENWLSLVIHTAAFHILLGTVPFVTSLMQTLSFSVYPFIPLFQCLPFIGTGWGLLASVFSSERTAVGAFGFCWLYSSIDFITGAAVAAVTVEEVDAVEVVLEVLAAALIAATVGEGAYDMLFSSQE